MRIKFLQIKRALSAALFVLLMVMGLMKTMAQTPYRQYANDGVLLNFHEIDNVDFRLFLLYSLSHDDRFVIIEDDTPGFFSIISDDEENNTGFYDTFEAFYQNAYTDFSLLSKTDILDLFPSWKSNILPPYLVSIMMDVSLRNTINDNYLCANSLPFFTTDVVQYEAASTSQTADQLEGTTLQDGCIGSNYNPSWFHLQISNPGQVVIHLEGRDPNTGVDRDIDFCVWGPFIDPITPCVAQLTTDKIMDCSYSASYSEDMYLGFLEGEHVHSTSHGTVNYHMPESGEYYILMITNYSREPCVISFSQIGGNGTSGCGDDQKTVTANINPTGGGIVSGAGLYDCGSSCTLSATANEGYVFMSWTNENGVVVSTDEDYSFTVYGNRNITANFVEDNSCYLTFSLNDSNGNGWSGNYLVLSFEDGSSQKLTVPYGLSASSYSLPIADGSHISLGWISGANTDQCSFLVSYSNGNGIYNGTDLNENLNYEFDVNCVEMPAMFYTISATANPSTGGMVSCNSYSYHQIASYDFENGMQGWTSIDADGDGHDWMLNSQWNANVSGHNGSVDFVMSESYINDLGSLHPDNYLISPAVTFDNESGISFWACAQDASYAAEHFGVAISISGNMDVADFTTIQEWTMTSKGIGTPTEAARSDNRSQGVWRQFTVDLSAYAGQTGYVAIRHFNCTDWFHINIDDITITDLAMIVGGAQSISTFSVGETCTITASSNHGYAFENWMENGNVISTDAEFSFTVTGNRDLVSNFIKVPFTITATPNFANRGTVTGAGEYVLDDTCTLIATANTGYAFANWTHDGTMVSTDAEYSFVVTGEVALVANFVSASNIVFADANVKSICVAHWDTNGDGELSYVEAANVTDLSNYFQGNTEIMMFNELQYFIGLSSIGANAFQNCSNLMLMTLPNNITSIGNYAFYNCSGLIGGLTIPNSVITIGNYAFAGCSGFMGILTIGNSVTTIGNYAFNGCRNFTGSLNIPNSVTTIGDYAFNGCTAFWGTLTIGNSVTTIGNSAFYGCTGLVGDIVIPNSITSIGSNAFYDCHSFGGTLTLGNSVTTIGSSAFYNCYGLTGSLSIPNSVTTIGNSAFYNCYGFTGALIIGNSVTSIGSSAFYNCYGFAGTLTLGNSVTTIGSSAFYNCDSFTGNLDIPNSVTSIGSSAFYDCNGFVGGSLTIPSSVTSIGGDAFYYCTGFSEIYYNVTNHTDISEGYYNYPFRSCGGHLNIGNNVVRIAANMFRNANFTGILTIPNSVVAINDNAFNNCWHLTGTLVIPNSINTIGISAFQNCDGLSEIIMGNNVLVVGNTAFYSCSGLLKVTLPHPVTVIGIEAFRYCTQLSEINMQSMQAPSIGWDVFSDNATGRVINIPCGATENYSAGYWTEWTDALNEMCDGLEIIVEVNPLEAGNATGGGTYNYSEMCTLAATSNLGYPFLNWTKNGVVVSTEATYSFGVTESCTYVANFSDAPVSYAVIVTANSDDGGTVEGSGNYLYGATATLTAIANQGYHFLNWTENGEEISVDNTLSFVVTSDREIVANFEVIIEVQTLEFTQGWNWFSPNIEITLDDLKTALVEALPGTAISIKSQTQNISYNPNSNRWSGSLVWNVAKMYMIKVAGTCEIELEGMPINPADHPVAISSGANWLAFPLNSNMSLNNAFAGFALSGDKVRSQTNNALYNGIRWQGQLNTLEPNKGYIYISNSSDDRIFTFPTNTK